MGVMTEEQRAAIADLLGERVLGLYFTEVGKAGGDDGDTMAIGVTASVAVAASLLALRATDAATIVAAITCMAEAAAQDILG